jgi:hypothetical protein
MITFLLAAILVVLILAFFPNLIRALGFIVLVLLVMVALGHFTRHDEQPERPAIITSPIAPSWHLRVLRQRQRGLQLNTG